MQLVVSIRTRDRRRQPSGDNWDGRSLEWSTSSPPPAFNFAVLPDVQGEEPYWGVKSRARETQTLGDEPQYESIEAPRNSPVGFLTAFFAVVIGFALIWHIWWMAVLGFVGAYGGFVAFAWGDTTEKEIPAEEVARIDRANRAERQKALQENAQYEGTRA